MPAIQAKTLLHAVRQPDPWFGLRYNMNLYRGCQHQCVYCDSRSACYQIEDFAQILYKANALELLDRELAHKRIVGAIGTGSMNDPYMPIEAELRLTRGALEIIARRRFPVHVLTKGDLVLRDLDLLQTIGQVYAAVSFTITTADDELSRKLEPGAPPSSRRFAALAALAQAGVYCGVLLMPVLPFLEDTLENVTAVARLAKEAGAGYILPSFGVTLRDRQRDYFYARLDRLFPGLRQRYQQRYGERYYCPVPNAKTLAAAFNQYCDQIDLPRKMHVYGQAPAAHQMTLW